MKEQEEKAKDYVCPKDEPPKLISKERLHEILDILMPYGYSHYDDVYYTGVSPDLGINFNIITIVANSPKTWDSILTIIIEKVGDDFDETNCLGFYQGIMKVIAPELTCYTDKFDNVMDTIDFRWALPSEQDNCFNCEVNFKPILRYG